MLIVAEEDRVLRLVQVLLDDNAPAERVAAFDDYMAHDVPDPPAWRAQLRARLPGLFPVQVRLVDTPEALRRALPDADALIVESLSVDQAMLDAAPRLRCVQQFGAQLGHIDTAACAARGIPVRTLRRRTNTAVAEQTIALLLALAKRIPWLDGKVTAARAELAGGVPFRPYDRRHTSGANYARVGGIREVRGARLGLLGMGEIAEEVARMARGLGLQLLYHKRTRLGAEDEARLGLAYVSLEGLFAESDYLSIHVPLDTHTRGMVGEALLGRMKPGAFLINTARAEIVDEAALLRAVQSGRLGGLALDVHYSEPVADDHALLGHPDVILLPHTAGGSRLNNLADMEEMFAGIAQALAA
jgi:phosphoglycerate dehydrogenase-like enzyme